MAFRGETRAVLRRREANDARILMVAQVERDYALTQAAHWETKTGERIKANQIHQMETNMKKNAQEQLNQRRQK
jgi:hypothetical protein